MDQFVINAEGKTTNQVFNITDNRAAEITGLLADAIMDVTNNLSDYSFKGTGENDGKEGIFKGKILTRLLRDITDVQEKLFVIAINERLIDIANERMGFLRFKAAVKKIFGDLL